MRQRILPLCFSLPRIVRRAYSAPAERLIKVSSQCLFSSSGFQLQHPTPPSSYVQIQTSQTPSLAIQHTQLLNLLTSNTHPRSTTSPRPTQAVSASSLSPAPPPATPSQSNCSPNSAKPSPPSPPSTKQMAPKHRLGRCMGERRVQIRGGRRGL